MNERIKILNKAAEYAEYSEEDLSDAKSGYSMALGDFTDVFKNCRKAAKISLRDAARKLKISAPYLSDIELGRRPPNAKLREKMLKLFS